MFSTSRWISLAFLIFVSCATEEERRPNILFIAIDDLRPELGCYGNPVIKSPNIDQIAREGFVFNHHYVQVPTCGASRYALLSGRRPHTKAHLKNNVMAQHLSGKVDGEFPETLVHQLRRNGYYTAGIGKIGHSVDGFVYGYEEPVSEVEELPHSWDEFLFDHGRWGTGWNAFFGYADGSNRQDRKAQVKPYEKGKVDDNGYPDGLTTDLAINKLAELKSKDEPFFLGVGYFKPHLPFTAPEKYWELYDEDEVTLPINPDVPENVSTASLHKSNEFNQYALGEEKASLDGKLSDEYTRKIRKAYYACVSYIDAQVGLLLRELKKHALDKNTIVVIWGDHGWHLGDLRVWGKHTLSEYALRSAFIMKVPGLDGGREINSVVESVDIFPTLLDVCRVDLPVEVDGKSFLTRLTGVDENEDVAYSYFRNGISMRTDSFRITKYFREEEPKVELYDYHDDPHERTNVAAGNQEKVESLLKLLEEGDTGLYLD